MLPLVEPTIIFAVAFLIIIIKVLGMDLSLGAIAVAHVFVCLPFSVVVLMSALEGLDISLEEASRAASHLPHARAALLPDTPHPIEKVTLDLITREVSDLASHLAH